jgi:monoamine oxidase
MTRWDAIVVGGGAAGLMAARELSGAGFETLLLEARERLGGRVHTLHTEMAPPIELGAEFIHGAAPDVFRLIEGSQVLVDRLPDLHWWAGRGRLRERADFWQRVTTVLARAGSVEGDPPFASFLASRRLSPADRNLVRGFVEGYHAADPARLSTRSVAMNDSEQGGDNPQFRIVTGYDSLLDLVRSGIVKERTEIRTATQVARIAWRRGEVEVTARTPLGGEETHRARVAIVTLPVGVLAAGTITWDPRPRNLRAVEKLVMGDVCKLVFRFRERFWSDREFLAKRIARRSGDLNFVHTAGAEFPTWWSHEPAVVPMLTAWTGGPAAARLLALSEQERVERAIRALSSILRVPQSFLSERLSGWWTHDWSADPFSRGAYSYVLAGGSTARRRLGEPVDGTLWIAGEATHETESGTVAGALASGAKAAGGAIEALRRGLRPSRAR